MKKTNKALAITNKDINSLANISLENIKAEMEAKQPEWVKDLNSKEDMGNAIYGTSQEMLIAIDDVLIRYFHFTEESIKEFHSHLKDILTGVKEFEDHGLNITSPHSMDIIGEKIFEIGITGLLQEIANTKLIKEKMSRSGLEYPVSLQATPFIRKLKEKNK